MLARNVFLDDEIIARLFVVKESVDGRNADVCGLLDKKHIFPFLKADPGSVLADIMLVEVNDFTTHLVRLEKACRG